MPARKRRFAIALSFPGQHRAFARGVAAHLAEALGRKRVFYDDWYTPELRGSSGDLKLRRIYGEDSDLLVPFFSKFYNKPWCQIEWHTIRAVLAKRRQDDAVIPVHMDDTEVEGWEAIDIGIRRGRQSAHDIARELVEVYNTRAGRAGGAGRAGRADKAGGAGKAGGKAGGAGKPRASKKRAIVVLMDSTLPEVVYDADTRKKGGTNADDITDVIDDLPIVAIKETTSLAWHRDEEVLRLNPDLIVLHFSAFYETTSTSDPEDRLGDFLRYVAGSKAQILIYSRMDDRQLAWLTRWVADLVKQTPKLKQRIQILRVKRGPGATFRNPDVARQLKLQVKTLLGI